MPLKVRKSSDLVSFASYQSIYSYPSLILVYNLVESRTSIPCQGRETRQWGAELFR